MTTDDAHAGPALDAADGLREAIANVCHRHWADHVGHVLRSATINLAGGAILPTEYVQSLRRQAATPYRMMGQIDRAWDRKEADAILALVRDDRDRLAAALARETERAAALRRALGQLVALGDVPISDLGGVDESILGQAMKMERRNAAAIARAALAADAPGDAGKGPGDGR